MKYILCAGALALLVPYASGSPAWAQKPGSPGFHAETPQQKKKRLAWQERRAEIRKERKRAQCVAKPEKRGCDKILSAPQPLEKSQNAN